MYAKETPQRHTNTAISIENARMATVYNSEGITSEEFSQETIQFDGVVKFIR
jgi:hypothetical protein